jgi:hypothetical protein
LGRYSPEGGHRVEEVLASRSVSGGRERGGEKVTKKKRPSGWSSIYSKGYKMPEEWRKNISSYLKE